MDDALRRGVLVAEALRTQLLHEVPDQLLQRASALDQALLQDGRGGSAAHEEERGAASPEGPDAVVARKDAQPEEEGDDEEVVHHQARPRRLGQDNGHHREEHVVDWDQDEADQDLVGRHDVQSLHLDGGGLQGLRLLPHRHDLRRDGDGQPQHDGRDGERGQQHQLQASGDGPPRQAAVRGQAQPDVPVAQAGGLEELVVILCQVDHLGHAVVVNQLPSRNGEKLGQLQGVLRREHLAARLVERAHGDERL
mmetsp:Transcript_22893/g.60488  ORF Transcript_22893/g.60488 Transcript_22893/m.60488 type:complete len:252 (-) Transcript_22893:940-1695(-)